MKKRIAALVAALVPLPLAAADWQVVSQEGSRVIEIDRASLIKAEAGRKVAWGRLRLEGAEAKRAGYSVVKALNRYDCQTLRFVTVKRVYLDADQNILREERPTAEREIPLIPGTVDERLFREVCRTNQLAEVARLAEAADGAAARAAQDKPVVQPVADTHVEPAQVAEPPPAPKKRFIQLGDLRAAAAESQKELERAGKGASESHAAEAAPPAVAPAPAPAHAPAPAPVKQAVREPVRIAAHVAPPRVVSRKPREQKPAEPAPHAAHHGDVHWSYEGETGPAQWGKLKPEWSACEAGRRQSPIDIRDGIGVDLPAVKFDYRVTRFNVVDNGHTVQVNVGEGSSITVSGHQYELKQFHFHKPSEERVGGKLYDMVAHLVHQDYDGRLAVVAVLLEKGAVEHPVIQTVWNNLPLEKNVEMAAEDAIDLNGLLPATHDHFTYMGSLTTPPCSEGVLWMVMKTPVSVSEQQVAIFGHLYRNNARPVQAANGRLIKQSR